MLHIRPYEPEDGKQLVGWFGEERSFRYWSADQYDTYPITAEQLNARYHQVTETQSFYAFTAVEEGEVVGHFTLRQKKEENQVGRFGFVAVAPEVRKKGYGRRMLTLGLQYAFENLNLEQVELGVFEENVSARRCYERLGFHRNPQEYPKIYRLCQEKWLCLELVMTQNEWKERLTDAE